MHLDNSDIPSREVKSYYIKESSYYDQATATFHTKVIALCPIMEREDDFGDGATKYPLFWVKYDDLAPYLAKQQIMTSNLNNAAMMSIDDYFTRNLYKGKIYKTTNMLGRTLAQYCSSDSAMNKEQKRIERELAEFEKNIWQSSSQGFSRFYRQSRCHGKRHQGREAQPPERRHGYGEEPACPEQFLFGQFFGPCHRAS